jgi:iron uptake system component EfeO
VRSGPPLLLAAFALLAAGCGSGQGTPAGAKTLSFELTDAGCDPHDAAAPAGPITFEIEGGSSSVTELEVLDGEKILGEKENVTDGLTGGFSLDLEAGVYTLRCDGGRDEDGTLTVRGDRRQRRTGEGAVHGGPGPKSSPSATG